MSNKVPMALDGLHRAENDLAEELLRLSDGHKAEHEVYHLARDLARWSQQHVRELAQAGEPYGLNLDAEPRDDPTLLARLRQKGAELVEGHHDAALLLLRDLRAVHRMAAGVSLDWEILAQTAQALKDTELLELAEKCHPQTLRQMRWANATLKEQSAQTMVT
jgi:hypothetical protein